MVEGTVTFFNERGSYGFIETEDDDEDESDDGEVFFHMADINGPDLQEGQEVEFEIEQSDKGPRAANLNRLGDAAIEEDDTPETDGDVIVDENGDRWVSINDM